MKKLTLILILAHFSLNIFAQEDSVINVNIPSEQKYQFSTVIDIEASNVKNQGNTGTCWSFSASSFLESEIYRTTGEFIDISEMYNVRHTYNSKAYTYVMRQGKTQFSEGGLAHDVFNSIKLNGLVPEYSYTGLATDSTRYNHEKLVPKMQLVLDNYIKLANKTGVNWKKQVDSILNIELGVMPQYFIFNGVTYNSKSFLEYTQINPSSYLTLTSFTHQPFYNSIILDIPDNFSNGIFYNIPISDLVSTVDEALKKGFTLTLDCDVSEETFSQKYGIAVIPKNSKNNEKSMTYIVEEPIISPEFRQQEFENYNTTDDHLMHIIGLVKDQNGTEYYKIKNSWGASGSRIGNGGYLFMSKTFFKLKTISVTLHNDAISETLKKQLKT
ncbi:C1 family peptidase [Lutibacter sp.]|uniref:C1 family peptidase n=1 Tax=Lutibacter sp. TaxID=1925666 RepID=UPI0027333C6F|nr:C1 family peptidase [Lutibacter sp.]MDP3312497.1 C1 family peptidase [Lutibacter sp.]